MSMFCRNGLVISLPGAELDSLKLSGSMVLPNEILAQKLSVELRAALLLVFAECERHRTPVKIVARPEIFTHGDGARWLRERLGDIAQHLCLSDGSCIKKIANCETHVFFYRLDRYENYKALRKLTMRAPELMVCVRSQINTMQTLGVGEQEYIPASLFLTNTPNFPRPEPKLLPFFLNRHSALDSAARIEQRGELDAQDVPPYEDVLYIPLTETSLHCKMYARLISKTIVNGFFSTRTLILLRLPPAAPDIMRLATQIGSIVGPLRDSQITIPRSCPPSVVLLSDDLIPTHPLINGRPWRMLVHESYDFWRHSQNFYQEPQDIVVMSGGEATAPSGFLPIDSTPMFGSKAQRVWLNSWPQD